MPNKRVYVYIMKLLSREITFSNVELSFGIILTQKEGGKRSIYNAAGIKDIILRIIFNQWRN